jgi:hypothetical protein
MTSPTAAQLETSTTAGFSITGTGANGKHWFYGPGHAAVSVPTNALLFRSARDASDYLFALRDDRVWRQAAAGASVVANEARRVVA